MMGEHFDRHQEASVPATPEEVWEAIATGPGIDTWFLGHNRLEPGEGGEVATDFPGIPTTEVTVWDPPRRLVHANPPGDDGRFIAYEFLVEGRSDSTTVVRLATSGFLPGDDWKDEYEAMGTGGDLFFGTLVEALTHFPGRRAVPVTAFGPVPADPEGAWVRLAAALGSQSLEPGNRVSLRLEGVARVDGEVYLRNRDTVGIRTVDGLYRFIAGLQGPFIATHHLFGEPVDPDTTGAGWDAWLHATISEETQ